MDLAFVGSEQEWEQLQYWLGSSTTHRLVAVLPDPISAAWTNWPPAAHRRDDFESILIDPQIDALVLGGPIPLRPERLRRAAQTGKACLCFHPADTGANTYHELAMIAEETHAVLMPRLEGRLHPAYAKLLECCRSETFGKLVALHIGRVGAGPGGQGLVAGSYAEAADLLIPLVKEVVEVIATGELASGRLVVQHRAVEGTTAEVRLVPGTDSRPRWTIGIEAEQGTAQVVWETGFLAPAKLSWSDASGRYDVELPASTADLGILEQLARARAGQPHTPNWEDGIRAAELAECAWQSLVGRRSVDVYHEKKDELASFKGTMTSCGCGLLWLTLAVLAVVAAGRGLGIPGVDWLVVVTAVVWATFLGLQAFRWVFPRQTR